MAVRMKSLAFVALFMSALWMGETTPPACAAVTIEAEINKEVVRVGETALLVITVSSDAGDQLNTPTMPSVPGLTIQNRESRNSMNFTLVNGQRTFVNRTEVIFELTPRHEGEFTLDSIRVATSSGYLVAEPVTLKASNEEADRLERQAESPSSHGGPDANRFGIHVVGQADKEQAYVGEEIILTYYLLIPREWERNFRVNRVIEPSGQFRNFWIENHDLPRNREERYLPLQNNRTYKQLTLSRVSLFALSAGVFSIDPLELESEIADGQVGMIIRQFQPLMIRSNVVELNIIPLPEEDKPDMFQGAVGRQFRLTADANPRELKEGEPITLKIQLEGHGNIRNAPRPILPDLSKFDRFDPTVDESIQVLKSGVLGRLDFSYVLIPHDSTVSEIGPVRFAYFNPREEQYVVLQTDSISLLIEPVTNDGSMAIGSRTSPRRLVTRMGDDFRFISTSPMALSTVNMAVYQIPLFWTAASLPLLMVGCAVGWRKRMDYLENNPEAARRLKAPTMAHRALAQARAALREQDNERMYALARKAITDYLDHHWGISCAGLTTPELKEALLAKGYPDDLIESLGAFFQKTDDVRFSGGALLDYAEMEMDLQHAEEILTRIMKWK